MPALLNVVAGSGADFADLGVGFFGELDLPFSPMGVYLPGTMFGSVVKDQTGNGFDATILGSPARQALFASCAAQNCFEVPVTGDQLAAAGSGFTMLAVARAPAAANGTAVSNYDTASTRNAALFLRTTLLANAFSNPGGSNSSLPTDAERGNRWGLFAGIVTPTSVQAVERHAGAAMSVATAATYASRAIGGPAKFRLGGHYAAAPNFPDSVDIACVVLCPSALTTGNIETMYGALSSFLAPKGLVL